MMVTSLLETVFITNLLCGSAHYTPPPRWIKVLVLHFLGRLVGLPPKPTELEDAVIQNPDAQGCSVVCWFNQLHCLDINCWKCDSLSLFFLCNRNE